MIGDSFGKWLCETKTEVFKQKSCQCQEDEWLGEWPLPIAHYNNGIKAVWMKGQGDKKCHPA
jgi:hypothetical protein